MSRRNTRQGKARRRGERDRRQVTERERKRPGIQGQVPQAVADQAAPRPDGSGPRSDAGGSLIAVDPGETDLGPDADLENADPGDFSDLDPDEADLQAVLAEEELGEGDLGEVAGELAGDVDVPEIPNGPAYPVDSQPGQPSADIKVAGPSGASARVVTPSPDGGGGEDEEILVLGDDDDDLPAAQVMVAGATADPVKDYLKQIGKVRLLNAEQEVELAKRIEAGLFAEEKLAERENLSTDARIDLEWIAEDGIRAKNHLLEANLRLVVSLARRYTGRGMLFLDLIQEGTWA